MRNQLPPSPVHCIPAGLTQAGCNAPVPLCPAQDYQPGYVQIGGLRLTSRGFEMTPGSAAAGPCGSAAGPQPPAADAPRARGRRGGRRRSQRQAPADPESDGRRAYGGLDASLADYLANVLACEAGGSEGSDGEAGEGPQPSGGHSQDPHGPIDREGEGKDEGEDVGEEEEEGLVDEEEDEEAAGDAQFLRRLLRGFAARELGASGSSAGEDDDEDEEEDAEVGCMGGRLGRSWGAHGGQGSVR
jgi:hypothetical protein